MRMMAQPKDDLVRNEKAVQNLMFAQMTSTESVRVFAVRLLNLAQAYPDLQPLQMAEHDMIQQAFLSTLPNQIQRAIKDYLHNHKWLTNQRMTFVSLVFSADRHHQDLKARGRLSTSPEIVNVPRVAADTREPATRRWSDVVKWKNTPSSPQFPKQQETS